MSLSKLFSFSVEIIEGKARIFAILYYRVVKPTFSRVPNYSNSGVEVLFPGSVRPVLYVEACRPTRYTCTVNKCQSSKLIYAWTADDYLVA